MLLSLPIHLSQCSQQWLTSWNKERVFVVRVTPWRDRRTDYDGRRASRLRSWRESKNTIKQLEVPKKCVTKPSCYWYRSRNGDNDDATYLYGTGNIVLVGSASTRESWTRMVRRWPNIFHLSLPTRARKHKTNSNRKSIRYRIIVA